MMWKEKAVNCFAPETKKDFETSQFGNQTLEHVPIEVEAGTVMAARLRSDFHDR
jgi:hypothetical protein